MTKKFLAICILFLLLKPICYSQTLVTLDSLQEDNLTKQINELGRAFFAGEYEQFVRYTHPKAVKMLGGQEKMITTLKHGLAALKNQGFTFKSISFGDHSLVLQTVTELFTYVQQKVELEAPEGMLIAKSTLLSVSEDLGRTWRFLDSAPLTEKNIIGIFPNYDLKLPIPQNPKPTYIENKRSR